MNPPVITLLTDADPSKRLCKAFSLVDGKPVPHKAKHNAPIGVAERCTLNSGVPFGQLHNLKLALAQHQNLICGQNINQSIPLTLGNKKQPGMASRCNKDFPFPEGSPGVVPIDADCDNAPTELNITPETFLPVITAILPGLRFANDDTPGAGYSFTLSSSAGIYQIKNDISTYVKEPNKFHLLLLVNDVSQVPAFLDAAFDEAVLAGYFWYAFTPSGFVRAYTPFDKSMAKPSQPIYGKAVLGEGLHRYGGCDRYHEGNTITLGNILNLKDDACIKRKAEATEKLGIARAEFIEANREQYDAVRNAQAEAKGISREKLDDVLDNGGDITDMPMRSVITLREDKGHGLEVTAQIIADNLALYNAVPCGDVIEPDYNSIIYTNKGYIVINSYSHGVHKKYIFNKDAVETFNNLANGDPVQNTNPPTEVQTAEHPAPLPYFLADPVNPAPVEATALAVAVAPRGTLILPSDHYDYTEAGPPIFEKLASRKQVFWRGSSVVGLEGGELSVMNAESLVSRLDKCGIVMKHIKDQNGRINLRNKRCPKETAKVLLASEYAAQHLPNIQSVHQQAVLTTDGRILQKGYHGYNGGVLVLKNANIPEVEPEVAVKYLSGLLQDFDFVSPGDRSRAVASFISPAMAAGGFFSGPPVLDLAEADKSQSGKTYRQAMVRCVYGEQAYAVAQKKGGVGSVDESIAKGLISGRPFIALDNFRGFFDSPMIEQVLTWEGEVSVRVPHQGEVNVDATGVTFQASSNGMETSRDLANRSAITRIQKRKEGYVYSSWPEGDVMVHIKANQSWYLGCVYSVVKAWIAAGKPGIACDHDRRYWAEPLNWVVQKVFGLGDLMEGHKAAKERQSNPGAAWLRRMGLHMRNSGRLGEVYSALDLAELAIEENIMPETRAARNQMNPDALAKLIGGLIKSAFREGEVLTEGENEAGGGSYEYSVIALDRITFGREQEDHGYQYTEQGLGQMRWRKRWLYSFGRRDYG